MKKHIAILSMLTLCLLSIPSYGVIWFDDGGVHDVNSVVDDEIQVWDNEAVPAPTTVNFKNGFSSTYPIEVHLNSSINIFGGTFPPTLSLTAFDNSETTFEGGTFEGNIMSWDNSIIRFEGGTFTNVVVSSFDSCNLFISADDFDGNTIRLYMNSYAEINNGTCGNVNLEGNSQVYIPNGEIGFLEIEENGKAIVSGGSLYSITLSDYGVVFVHGTHFAINGTYVGTGEITHADYSNGTLTCKLYNGDFMDTSFSFYTYDSRMILTSEKPESPVYCISHPSMDTNNDCKIDMTDFAEFASQWLSCGLSAQEACWE